MQFVEHDYLESLFVKGVSTAEATRINSVVQLAQEWIIGNT